MLSGRNLKIHTGRTYHETACATDGEHEKIAFSNLSVLVGLAPSGLTYSC
jgi:hypothetical protein